MMTHAPVTRDLILARDSLSRDLISSASSAHVQPSSMSHRFRLHEARRPLSPPNLSGSMIMVPNVMGDVSSGRAPSQMHVPLSNLALSPVLAQRSPSPSPPSPSSRRRYMQPSSPSPVPSLSNSRQFSPTEIAGLERTHDSHPASPDLRILATGRPMFMKMEPANMPYGLMGTNTADIIAHTAEGLLEHGPLLQQQVQQWQFGNISKHSPSLYAAMGGIGKSVRKDSLVHDSSDAASRRSEGIRHDVRYMCDVVYIRVHS